MKSKNIVQNSHTKLTSLTNARIGLGHCGVSLPTKHMLDFQLAHAMAQDAVYLELDLEVLDKLNMPTIVLHSQAKNRIIYLQRPDLGKKLDLESIKKIQKTKKENFYDLAIVIVDGLSSLAIHENAYNFIDLLSKELPHYSTAPLCIVKQGRVAIGDEVGELLNAKVVIVLIGERPGLSSPDSLGLYLTWGPRIGLTDERRNCISNIRFQGLSYDDAVQKTLYLLSESKRLKYSGVNLKERTTTSVNKQIESKKKFLDL